MRITEISPGFTEWIAVSSRHSINVPSWPRPSGGMESPSTDCNPRRGPHGRGNEPWRPVGTRGAVKSLISLLPAKRFKQICAQSYIVSGRVHTVRSCKDASQSADGASHV